MNVRFHGGPMHNKTESISNSFNNPIRVQGYNRKRLSFLDADDYMNPAIGMKYGNYWQTGEHDKHGNRIYAWAGWR